MREIPLTQGYVALVDDADYEALARFPWHVVRRTERNVYAARKIRPVPGGPQRTLYMHAAILGAAGVDHRNGDGLDNRRANLRLGSQRQNSYNARPHGASRFKGVSWRKDRRLWVARIRPDRQVVVLGYFTSEVEAAQAYDVAAAEHFGEFAWTNFPREDDRPALHRPEGTAA